MSRGSKDVELAIKPPVVSPSTTQFMNLSAYMYQAYNTPYSSTTLQNDIGFVPLTTAGGKQVLAVNDQTGLYAQAFVSTGAGPKQIVVAYEGTNLFGQSPAFTGAQVQDDAQIFNGRNALSYRGAASFAARVTRIAARQGVGRNEVFVTGHSLGAAEAEYAASKTGLAGTTFAGPGIYQTYGRGRVSKLTNYVDAADPVGNYSADTVLAPTVTTGNIRHYGSATVLINTSTDSMGNPTPYNNVMGASILQDAASNWASAGQTGQLLLLYGVAVNNLKNHDFHSLTQYANDLGVTLYNGDSSGTAGQDFFPLGASSASASAAGVANVTLCFVGGTRIRTSRGEVAVEDLRAGDNAVTASGALRPVTWIGARRLGLAGRPLPGEQQPVRIAAGAFGCGLPTRDLMLSPGHPVLVGADEDGEGGHLVPIMCLINGTTIERAATDDVTYWHVELDEHDILLAEGLPAESYIDLGSRPWFAGADGALDDPDLVLPGMPGRCRPVAIDGPIVDAERRRLESVFAMRLAAACAWPDFGTEAV